MLSDQSPSVRRTPLDLLRIGACPPGPLDELPSSLSSFTDPLLRFLTSAQTETAGGRRPKVVCVLTHQLTVSTAQGKQTEAVPLAALVDVTRQSKAAPQGEHADNQVISENQVVDPAVASAILPLCPPQEEGESSTLATAAPIYGHDDIDPSAPPSPLHGGDSEHAPDCQIRPEAADGSASPVPSIAGLKLEAEEDDSAVGSAWEDNLTDVEEVLVFRYRLSGKENRGRRPMKSVVLHTDQSRALLSAVGWFTPHAADVPCVRYSANAPPIAQATAGVVTSRPAAVFSKAFNAARALRREKAMAHETALADASLCGRQASSIWFSTVDDSPTVCNDEDTTRFNDGTPPPSRAPPIPPPLEEEVAAEAGGDPAGGGGRGDESPTSPNNHPLLAFGSVGEVPVLRREVAILRSALHRERRRNHRLVNKSVTHPQQQQPHGTARRGADRFLQHDDDRGVTGRGPQRSSDQPPRKDHRSKVTTTTTTTTTCTTPALSVSSLWSKQAERNDLPRRPPPAAPLGSVVSLSPIDENVFFSSTNDGADAPMTRPVTRATDPPFNVGTPRSVARQESEVDSYELSAPGFDSDATSAEDGDEEEQAEEEKDAMIVVEALRSGVARTGPVPTAQLKAALARLGEAYATACRQTNSRPGLPSPGRERAGLESLEEPLRQLYFAASAAAAPPSPVPFQSSLHRQHGHLSSEEEGARRAKLFEGSMLESQYFAFQPPNRKDAAVQAGAPAQQSGNVGGVPPAPRPAWVTATRRRRIDGDLLAVSRRDASKPDEYHRRVLCASATRPSDEVWLGTRSQLTTREGIWCVRLGELISLDIGGPRHLPGVVSLCEAERDVLALLGTPEDSVVVAGGDTMQRSGTPSPFGLSSLITAPPSTQPHRRVDRSVKLQTARSSLQLWFDSTASFDEWSSWLEDATHVHLSPL